MVGISVSLFLALSLKLFPFPQEPGGTAVHELVETPDVAVGSVASFHWKTDIDGDGIVDPVFWTNSGSGTLARGGDLKVLVSYDGLMRRRYLDQPNRWVSLQGGGVVLNRNGDLVGVSTTVHAPNIWNFDAFRDIITFFDLQSGDLIKKMRLPTEIGSQHPTLESVYSIQSVGDLNSDGYDDLLLFFGVGGRAYQPIGLVNGMDLEMEWIQSFPAARFHGVGMRELTGLPWEDLDGDGWGDLLFTFQEEPVTGTEWGAIRLSGATGRPLWRRYVELSTPGFTSRIGDVNGDGVADIFGYINSHTPSHHEGRVWALDGANGGLIWSRKMTDYDRYFVSNPPAQGGTIEGPGLLGPDLNQDGVPEILVRVNGTAWPQRLGQYWFYLCGLTGDRLLWTEFSLDPVTEWADGQLIGLPVMVGDVDHDGWPEMLVSLAPPGFGEGQVYATLIGHRTLRAPADVNEGESILLTMHLPSAGGRPYRLYLSTAFEPYGDGFHLGDWNTHLGDSLLLGASLQSLSLRGTLSAGGKASHRMRIPIGAGLAGKTIHAIAIVEDATRPGGVWCKSTVASIEILP